jgi:hypothetical protein
MPLASRGGAQPDVVGGNSRGANLRVSHSRAAAVVCVFGGLWGAVTLPLHFEVEAAKGTQGPARARAATTTNARSDAEARRRAGSKPVLDSASRRFCVRHNAGGFSNARRALSGMCTRTADVNRQRCAEATGRRGRSPALASTLDHQCSGPPAGLITSRLSLITLLLPSPPAPAIILPRQTSLMKLRRIGESPYGPDRCGEAQMEWDGRRSWRPRRNGRELENECIPRVPWYPWYPPCRAFPLSVVLDL